MLEEITLWQLLWLKPISVYYQCLQSAVLKWSGLTSLDGSIYKLINETGFIYLDLKHISQSFKNMSDEERENVKEQKTSKFYYSWSNK